MTILLTFMPNFFYKYVPQNDIDHVLGMGRPATMLPTSYYSVPLMEMRKFEGLNTVKLPALHKTPC